MELLHADVDEPSWALRRQVLTNLRTLSGSVAHAWYERPTAGTLDLDGVHGGVMDLDDVDLPDGAAYHLCGPLPFMQAMRSALLERGVQAQEVQYEVFGPDLWQADLASTASAGLG